jgi:glucoside 3-dehydrogenase (cytochrome c) hitch-hiker subunit
MSTNLGRRDALKKLAAVAMAPLWVEALAEAAGRHAAAHHATIAGTPGPWMPKVLSADQNAAVVALAEIIIPQTDTPGATAAKVNEFIDLTLHDAEPADRQKFLDGLSWLDTHVRERHGAVFAGLDADTQIAILTALAAADPPAEFKPGADLFKAIKSLTVTGYYTSEVAMKEELDDDLNMFFAEFKGCTHPEHQS